MHTHSPATLLVHLAAWNQSYFLSALLFWQAAWFSYKNLRSTIKNSCQRCHTMYSICLHMSTFTYIISYFKSTCGFPVNLQLWIHCWFWIWGSHLYTSCLWTALLRDDDRFLRNCNLWGWQEFLQTGKARKGFIDKLHHVYHTHFSPMSVFFTSKIINNEITPEFIWMKSSQLNAHGSVFNMVFDNQRCGEKWVWNWPGNHASHLLCLLTSTFSPSENWHTLECLLWSNCCKADTVQLERDEFPSIGKILENRLQ